MTDGSDQEAARGRDALRGLGVDPVPEDVLARVEARLDLELPAAPVRPAAVRRPRRRLGLLLGAPVAAAAAIIAVLLIGSPGSTNRPSGGVRASAPAASTAQRSAAKAPLPAYGAAAVAHPCPKGEVRRRARPGAPARCRPRHPAGAR
jgi:hypothetical protein